jgi:tRNA-dependent cyclodipeptide synthase
MKNIIPTPSQTRAHIDEDRSRVLVEGGTVLFLVSLHNGYFKRQQIGELISAIDREARAPLAFHFLITDGPSIHNYRALGYGDSEALPKIAKARRQVSNQILHALHDRFTTLNHHHSFATVAWPQVYRDPHFISQLERMHELYQSDAYLRSMIREGSCNALSAMARCQSLSQARFNESDEERLEEASHYVLEELALILASRHMPLCTGSNAAVFYYRQWPLLEYVLAQNKNS